MLELVFKEVTMRDRGRQVVEGLNRKLSAGESVALIGAPRTGKTRLLLMVGGYVKPTVGAIFWLDEGEKRPVCPREVGVSHLHGLVPFFPTLTVKENMETQARLYNVKPVRENVEEAIGYWGLGQQKNQRLKDLLPEQMYIASVAIALLHQPRLLLLDEPERNIGQQKWPTIWTKIKEMQAKNGMIVFVATLSEQIASVCSARISLGESG